MEQPPERIEVAGFALRRQGTEPDDAARIASTVAANLERLAVWMPWASAESATAEAQTARLVEVREAWDQGREYQYLAVAPDGTHLGTFGLMRRIGPRAIEIGYWLAATAEGRGVATTSARALAAAGLALADVDRVEIRCDEANTRSVAVARRAGFRLDRTETRDPVAPGESGRCLVWVLT